MIHSTPLAAHSAVSSTVSPWAPLMVPAELRPGWAQLPALAGVVTDRLANRSIRYPVVGLPIRWSANLLNLATLAGAKLAGRLICRGSDAVMWYVPLHPSPAATADRLRSFLPRMTALIPMLSGYVLALALTLIPGVPAAVSATAVAFALWCFAGALAMLRRGNNTKIIRRVQSYFDGTGVTLVLACGLARTRRESGHDAVVEMLLPMLRAADDQQVTIVAHAITRQMAARYLRHGFRQLPTGERHLVRAPRKSRSHRRI